jgi:hypothetical protein
MTPERWEQVKQVFEAALGRSPEERHGFVERAAANLAPPAETREYVARVLVACGRFEEAWTLYRAAVEAQGRIWYQPEANPPGFWADMLYQYAGRTSNSASPKPPQPDTANSAPTPIPTRQGCNPFVRGPYRPHHNSRKPNCMRLIGK